MAFLNDLTLQQIITRLIGYLIVAGLQGFVLAGAASMLGDRAPAHEGRLTPSPFAHLAMAGLFMTVLFRAGWIRPLRIHGQGLRGGRYGVAVSAGLTLAALALLVPAIDLVRPWVAASLPRTTGQMVLIALQQTQAVAIGTLALNLLPFPPLVGGHVLIALFPAMEERMIRLEPVFTGLLVVALVAGWLPDPVSVMAPFFMG